MFCILMLVVVVSGCATPSNQISALNELYTATNGTEWTDNTNWEDGDPCGNNWFGVTCNSSCQVIQISLFQNNLHGTIPTSIANLSALIILDMSQNELSGTVPASLGDISLIQLYLQNNALNGAVPSFLQNPWPNATTTFNISSNDFSCPLPGWCSDPPSGNGLCAPCICEMCDSNAGLGWMLLGIVVILPVVLVAYAGLYYCLKYHTQKYQDVKTSVNDHIG